MKPCKQCENEKPFDAFHKGSGKGGRHPVCKDCRGEHEARPRRTCDTCSRAKTAAGFEADETTCRRCVKHPPFQSMSPEELARAARGRKLKARYGIDLAQYDELLQLAGGACQICRCVPGTGEALAVDHCHDTGRVRGLLCRPCNMGLGHFRDRADLLDAAKKYLAD